jgi:hypothetical protein
MKKKNMLRTGLSLIALLGFNQTSIKLEVNHSKITDAANFECSNKSNQSADKFVLSFDKKSRFHSWISKPQEQTSLQLNYSN